MAESLTSSKVSFFDIYLAIELFTQSYPVGDWFSFLSTDALLLRILSAFKSASFILSALGDSIFFLLGDLFNPVGLGLEWTLSGKVRGKIAVLLCFFLIKEF